MWKILIITCTLLLLQACSPVAENPTATSQPVAATSTQPAAATATLPVETGPTQAATATSAPAATATETVSSTPSQPASFPDPARVQWQTVASRLSDPVGVANAGEDRLFILERQGRIMVLQNGQVNPQPFLDIVSQVGSRGSEQGLLGLAFHPDYAENGYLYINYTDLNGDTVIARYQVSTDPDLADPDSELQILTVDQPYANHNGGEVTFGPDGYLYLGLGDGGSGGDPHGNGQSLATRLGKILRIDVNGDQPFSIPADNPFAAGQPSGALPEIWAYGLRNPWRFSFDRQTGDLYIGDVGQNQWEEIDYLPSGSPGGANFGWVYYEGTHPGTETPPSDLEAVMPVAEYDHSQGCSVTGGVVYRGQDLPAWQGIYLYGDYCSGMIWGLVRDSQGNWENRLLFETNFLITSFGEDAQGEVYLADIAGNIARLAPK